MGSKLKALDTDISLTEHTHTQNIR
jgi:hypothetical protein